MSPRPPTLLFVDDEPDILDIARTCFEQSGWTVYTANSVAAAKAMLRREAIDAVVSDLMMTAGTGLDLLHHVRSEHGPEFVFYLLTGSIDERTRRAVEEGAHGVFFKPCDWNHVVETVHLAVQARMQPQPG